jgi:hypothetical protein
MDVKLTRHTIELLEAVRAQRKEPIESILEHALEILVREEHVEPSETMPSDAQRRAVSEMIEFSKYNRVRLGTGLFVKDLIHEGHRV